MERLTESEIQRFREISIHSIVAIRDTGRRFDGACPFCNRGRNTPCFSLYPDNSYHCYSCGAHGANAVDFMKQLTGKTDFVDILNDLIPYL